MAVNKVRMIRVSTRTMLMGAVLALTSTLFNTAQASTLHGGTTHGGKAIHRTAYHHTLHHSSHSATHVLHSSAHEGRTLHGTHHYIHHTRYAAHYRHSGLQCVPYAREISHIALTGNAYLWWAEAAGRYARGNMPEQGAVLNFRAIGRMPLGHVAVVTGVINSRTILVTQANWVRGTITNDVTVQDVSPDNDWTQVKVELGDSSTWGAAYPTYGFIYNRADAGTVIASGGPATEVAEAPPAVKVSSEAPNRNLQ